MNTNLKQSNGFTFLESIVVMLSIILLLSIVGPGLFHKEKKEAFPIKAAPEFGSSTSPKTPPDPPETEALAEEEPAPNR